MGTYIIKLLAQVLFIVKLEIALKDVYKPRIKLRPGDFETTWVHSTHSSSEKDDVYSFLGSFLIFKQILNKEKNFYKKAHDLYSHGLTRIKSEYQSSKTEQRFLLT